MHALACGSGFDSTIQLLINLTLRASPLDISNNVVITDGATDALRSTLRVVLLEECSMLKCVRQFKKIVTVSSSREDGLQLADMVAGAICEKAWQNDQTYYRTLARKIAEWKVK